MPGIDEHEATVKIREWDTGKQRKSLNICALSAHAMERYRDRCFEVRLDGFLSKPIIMCQLQETLLRYQSHAN